MGSGISATVRPLYVCALRGKTEKVDPAIGGGGARPQAWGNDDQEQVVTPRDEMTDESIELPSTSPLMAALLKKKNGPAIPAVGPNWKRAGADLSVTTKNALTSPAKTTQSGVTQHFIDHTPKGPERESYKYFCPVCMLYFRDVLTTSCCRNYVCYSCALQFVRGKHGVDSEASAIPVQLAKEQECMHCRSAGLQLEYAQVDQLVRSYDDSPNTRKLLMRLKASAEPDCSMIEEAEDSLLESMDRKTLSFDDHQVGKGQKAKSSLDPRVEVDESTFVDVDESQFVMSSPVQNPAACSSAASPNPADSDASTAFENSGMRLGELVQAPAALVAAVH